MGRRPTGISAKQTPADSRLAGVCLCCTNFTLPTGNLDSRTSADVLGLLKRTSMEFDQTTVMITHNNEIAQLADRIIRIEDGRIVDKIAAGGKNFQDGKNCQNGN